MIPYEVRRQDFVQNDPCPEDVVKFTCTKSNASNSSLRWKVNGTLYFTFLIPDDIRITMTRESLRLEATLESNAITILIVNVTMNNTDFICDEVDIDGLVDAVNQTLTIIGKYTIT